jgi:hypothetical protein
MTMLSEFERLRLAEALCRSDFVSFVYQVFRTLMPASTLQINYHIGLWRIILNWCGWA